MISLLNALLTRAIVPCALLMLAPTTPLLAQGIPGAPKQREPQSGEDAVKVSVAVVGTVAPNATVRIVATFDIIPSWHIYWTNPGQSGAPTRLKFTLPDGCVLATNPDGTPAIDFPLPTIFTHGETTFGYEKSVTISAAVKLPATIPSGGLPATVRSSWLVCKEICLMGRGESSIDLSKPVAADSKAAVALKASLAHTPIPLPASWKMAYSQAKELSAVLVIEAPTSVGADSQWQFIPNDTPGVSLETGYLAAGTGRTLVLPLSISRPSAGDRPLALAGLLILGKNGPAYSFTIPVPAP